MVMRRLIIRGIKHDRGIDTLAASDIPAGYALLLDSGEPRMASFVEELQRRLRVQPACYPFAVLFSDLYAAI